jgi:hypothetical protein
MTHCRQRRRWRCRWFQLRNCRQAWEEPDEPHDEKDNAKKDDCEVVRTCGSEAVAVLQKQRERGNETRRRCDDAGYEGKD